MGLIQWRGATEDFEAIAETVTVGVLFQIRGEVGGLLLGQSLAGERPERGRTGRISARSLPVLLERRRNGWSEMKIDVLRNISSTSRKYYCLANGI